MKREPTKVSSAPLKMSLRTECHDQRRQAEPRDDDAVDEAERGADRQGEKDRPEKAGAEAARPERNHRGVPGEDRDRGEGDVDPTGDDDEQNAEREDQRHDGAAHDREQRRYREEDRVEQRHHDDQAEQDQRKDALVVGTAKIG